ncbi:HAD family hydrolase [Salinirubellus salinus]|uniref:HAD family hydrolase n=1 Tax=Salinirubellus salinus TaxID=1364945 RepID=A0A9E7U6Q7_9EURY|nr:HAD family hydrolase [Salinirubellus salinus]UWM56700.1 HAD family hydrolase [Salinirubellus salinus]
MTERRVDTVLFDLDDTLCSYRRGGGELIELAFEQVGVDPFFDVVDYHARYPEFVDDTETVEELRSDCFAAIAADRGYDAETGRALADAFAAERDHRNVEATPGAHEALEHLADDHRLGLVTNGAPEMQAKKLDGIGIRDAFDALVFAGYDTPGKPDPAPFDHALSRLDAASDRAVHVGNSLGSDVAGAHAAGVGSAWLPDGTHDGPPEPTPDYTLDSLHDLQAPPWRE